MTSNRPIPDRLFAIRERIRKLTELEGQLKTILIANEATHLGLEYDAIIRPTTRTGLDRAKVRLKYPKVYAECQKITSFPVVTLKKKDPNDGW